MNDPGVEPGEMGEAIVRLARLWLGTPYRHQGAARGIGCDCLGLVRGLWRELYGREPEEPGPYGEDWAERSGSERLLDAARRHCGPPLPAGTRAPGDLLLFRWQAAAAAKHLGILTGPRHFIHAYEQVGVVESPLASSWEKRIVAVFRFPEAPIAG